MADKTPGRMQNLSNRAGTVRELYRYIATQRRWGMLVLLTILMLVSVIVVTAEAVHFLAPFVYTLF